METFNPSRLLEDVEKICNAIGAPFSQPTTNKVLEVYSRSFSTGAVLIRMTNRPYDALNYRFYSRGVTDTVDIAIKAGFLHPTNPLLPLLQLWSKPWSGHVPEQSVDFDSERGLSKIWVYQSGFRPLHDLMSIDGVPATVRHHEQKFKDLNLQLLRHVAVDFHSATVNLYFSISGSLSASQAADYTSLADSPPPTKEQLIDMQHWLPSTGFTFATTIAVATGAIKRVAIYALGLSKEAEPCAGPRVKKFFDVAPNYDAKEFRGVGWSFGGGEHGNYVKAEKSYCGNLVGLFRDWKTNLAQGGADGYVPAMQVLADVGFLPGGR